MVAEPLRIALLGGVPPSLGGGGLEIQLERTAAALTALGHDVFRVAREAEPRAFDVLHAFSSGPDMHFALEHWRRNPAPLILSPVIVVAEGRAERRQRIGSRLPIPAFGPRMRVELLQRADAVIALTQHEAGLIRAFGGNAVKQVVVIGNGVDPSSGGAAPEDLPDGYVALVGSVSPRKRQGETVAALAVAGIAAVVVGGIEGDAAAGTAFERQVAAAGGRWLGELDAETTRAIVRGARALVHLSSAEGQSLAVLEALAEGTPAIVAPLASNRELAARFGAAVVLCADPSGLAAAIGSLPPDGPPLAVPTWIDVARELESVYRAEVFVPR